MSTIRTVKLDRPESVRQARTWTEVKNRYVDRGLCHVCASQAAYGHQIGWTRVNGPCGICWRLWNGLTAGYGGTIAQVPGSVQAGKEADSRQLREAVRGRGPKSWELCYRVGGLREGLLDSDLEHWSSNPRACASLPALDSAPGQSVAGLDAQSQGVLPSVGTVAA